jgi:flagellum-specific peptidoglycan hydrolase FlgJ
MRQNTPNSFQNKEKYAQKDDLFNNGQGVQGKMSELNLTLLNFEVLIKKVFQILTKLFVAAKYQFFKRTQHANFNMRWKLPFQMTWFQLAFLAFAVYIVFKKDLSFSVNMKSPDTFIADREDGQSTDKNSSGFAQNVSLKDNSRVFADAPGDNAETRQVKSYIRRFKDVAQTEGKKYGIPASIKMAQALLESNAGRSGLSTKNNNHFGIKCFSKNCKKGHCANFNDDHHKDFFRKYKSPWESWRAHSKFIANGRYKSLKKHGNDYEAWAYGLKKLGYATDPNYPQKLIQKIQQYRLDLLD